MWDHVECLRKVYRHGHRPVWWAELVEALRHFVCEWEEGCGGGSVGSEAGLYVGEGNGVKLRELESLQHLDGGTQKGDGTVAAGHGGGFTRFEDRDNYCMFPDCRDVAVVKGEVENVGQVLDAERTKVLEVEDG